MFREDNRVSSSARIKIIFKEVAKKDKEKAKTKREKSVWKKQNQIPYNHKISAICTKSKG